MPHSGNPNSISDAPLVPGRKALSILATVAVLAVLYFTRDVLVPITLALFLSLLLAPFVNSLRRVGFGHTSSVVAVVVILMISFCALGTVIATQLAGIAASLPQYDKTIQLKLRGLERLTSGRVTALTAEAERTMGGFVTPSLTRPETAEANQHADLNANTSDTGTAGNTGQAPRSAPAIAVQVQAAPPNPWHQIQSIASALWSPLESTGIVLVILIFVLLEREALRDRLIKIIGSSDLRATTNALNDAGVRLSRFFISQFMVNFGVGVLIGLGLALCGIPHALLWAVMTMVLRFVPFVGVWIAAVFATILAAAVAPGWELPLATIAIFFIVELLASQLLEPQLYGHTTGLSPLTVVVAAIFWSWLWGPVGLVVSTPVTLCLLIAGRHTRALQLLDVILGDSPALTMPQRLYQRALSGDADEMISGARDYLKRKSFAAYCDCVLIPAIQLAAMDFEAGLISKEQGAKVRVAISSLITILGDVHLKQNGRRNKSTLLEDPNLGRALRHERERTHGRWQGPLDVPRGTIVLCVGLGSTTDELGTELLVRVLRSANIDARHLSEDDLDRPSPDGSSPASISLCFIVGARAQIRPNALEHAATTLHRKFPDAPLVTLFLREILPQPIPVIASPEIEAASLQFERIANSYVEALQICLEWQQQNSSRE